MELVFLADDMYDDAYSRFRSNEVLMKRARCPHYKSFMIQVGFVCVAEIYNRQDLILHPF